MNGPEEKVQLQSSTYTDDCPADQTISGREGTFSTNVSGTRHPYKNKPSYAKINLKLKTGLKTKAKMIFYRKKSLKNTITNLKQTDFSYSGQSINYKK